MTLPLIFTLQQVDSKRKSQLIRIVEKHNTDKKMVKELIQTVYDTGGIQYAQEKMKDLISQARNQLDELPDSAAKESMHGLINYVLERNM